MKLMNSLGPNPRIVRMFAAEKDIDLDFEEVDLLAGENRQKAYLLKNPSGQLPALVLDDGTCLSEITAICEYLEDTQASPSLVGTTPEEKAETRMWTRKLDLGIAEPMANGFRFAEGLEIFKNRLHVIPQAADDLKATAQEGLEKLDGWMDGKQFICGDRFTMADVHLFGMLDFFASVGQPIDNDQKNVAAWYERVGARPSAEKSLHPAAEAVGMRG
jgi:glutathione S-transferase